MSELAVMEQGGGGMGFQVESKPGATTMVSWKKLLEESGAADHNPGLSVDGDEYESDGTDDLDRYYMVDLKNGGFYPSEPSMLQNSKRSRKDAGKSFDAGAVEDEQNPKPVKKAKKSSRSLLEKSLEGLDIAGNQNRKEGEKARKPVKKLVENAPNNAAAEKIDEDKNGVADLPKEKNALLEKAIKELQKLVAELSPPSAQPEETKRRMIPQEIKQKLFEVAKASHGEISNELVHWLMSIVGHLMQVGTLKKNLRNMLKKDAAETDPGTMESKDQKCEASETLKPKKLKRKSEDEGDLTLLSMLKSCNNVKSRKDSNALPVAPPPSRSLERPFGYL